MPRLRTVSSISTVSFLLLSTATAANAELTAAEVWADWKDLVESSGQTLETGSEEQSGGVLTVQNMTLTMEYPEGNARATLDEIVFEEQGDGTVRITMSPDYRMNMAVRPEYGEDGDITMRFMQTGFEMIASGDPDALQYDLSMDDLDIVVEEMVFDDEVAPVEMTMSASDIEGVYSVSSEGELRAVDSDVTIASAEMQIDAENPDTDGTFEMNLVVDDVVISSSGTMSSLMNMTNLAEMLEAGMTSEGEVTHGPMNIDFAFSEFDETAQGEASAESGSLDYSLTRENLTYGTTSNGLEITASGSEIPLPEIAMSMEESQFGLTMPISVTDEPREFAFLTALRDLTISDGIWALFDPTGVLPRDPATVALDLTGSGRWFVDIMNPEAAADLSAAPGEVNSLTLNDLEVSLAGAALTGNGAFEFDNSDTVTFDGMPRPEGSIDLMLVGANGLLDKLIELGFLPEDEATGMRMMMGVFAQPGEGEDTLVSTIEVNEAGEVLANGQRLR